MNESCWLIFEHKHLLGKPAENVGWENSFAPIQCVCKSWGFAFLCISCVPFTQFLCCFSQRPRSDLITTLWLVSPSLLRQKSVAIDSLTLPLICSRIIHGSSFPTGTGPWYSRSLLSDPKPWTVHHVYLFFSLTCPLLQRYSTAPCSLNTFSILYAFVTAVPFAWDVPVFILHSQFSFFLQSLNSVLPLRWPLALIPSWFHHSVLWTPVCLAGCSVMALRMQSLGLWVP